MSKTKIEIIAASEGAVRIKLHSKVVDGHATGRINPALLLQIISEHHKALEVRDEVAQDIVKNWTAG